MIFPTVKYLDKLLLLFISLVLSRERGWSNIVGVRESLFLTDKYYMADIQD